MLIPILAVIITPIVVAAVVTDRRRKRAGGPDGLTTGLDPAASAQISADVMRTSDRTA